MENKTNLISELIETITYNDGSPYDINFVHVENIANEYLMVWEVFEDLEDLDDEIKELVEERVNVFNDDNETAISLEIVNGYENGIIHHKETENHHTLVYLYKIN